MKLELARSAGFCYGVRRAVELAEQAAAQGTPESLGPALPLGTYFPLRASSRMLSAMV